MKKDWYLDPVLESYSLHLSYAPSLLFFFLSKLTIMMHYSIAPCISLLITGAEVQWKKERTEYEVISMLHAQKLLKHFLFRLASVGVSTDKLDSNFLTGSTILYSPFFFCIWNIFAFFSFGYIFWLDSWWCVYTFFSTCFGGGFLVTHGVGVKLFWRDPVWRCVWRFFVLFLSSNNNPFLGHIWGNEHTVYLYSWEKKGGMYIFFVIFGYIFVLQKDRD